MIVTVTGMLKSAGSTGRIVGPPEETSDTPDLNVTVPVYVPGASDVGSINTVTVLGVVELFGATNNHAVLPVLVAVARNGSADVPSVLVTEIWR